MHRLHRISSHLTTSSSSSSSPSSSSSSSPPKFDDDCLVVLQPRKGLVILQLNRPKKLNAVNTTMRSSLHAFLDWLNADVRVVIIRGAGRCFCAGLDLNDGDMTAHVGHHFASQQALASVITRIHHAPQVFIAAVHHAASGFGFALALACDFRIAETASAKFNVAMRRIGMTGCDLGISYLLPRVVSSTSVARWLMYTGEFVNATEAHRVGLVDKVSVGVDRMNTDAVAMAEQLLKGSPMGLRLTKECFNHSLNATCIETAVAMEDRQQILTVASGDFMEGVSAFLQKRQPQYHDHH